jgi:hypothetical protein
MSDNKGRGWRGNPEGHRKAGVLGGAARKRSILAGASMSYQEMGHRGGSAAWKKGSAHKLTNEERSRGGKNKAVGKME